MFVKSGNQLDPLFFEYSETDDAGAAILMPLRENYPQGSYSAVPDSPFTITASDAAP